MAYERKDFRSQDDRGRDRSRGYERDYRGDDRGFFDRAGDEVRSWFGDDEAERRREEDARRYERERGRDFGDRWRGDYGRGTAGGFGNQRGWSDRSYEGRGGSGGAETFGGPASYGPSYGGPGGFGGDVDSEQRFDRIDVGSTGTQGSDSRSGSSTRYGGGYGIGPNGEYGSRSSARYADTGRGASDLYDRHYSAWRQRQIESLDNDYDDYRRENQSRFENEFGSWRSKRQGQRDSLSRVAEHMEVVGSDDQHIGTVDHVRGDRILLTKSDQDAGGRHHSIPCSWIDSVSDKVKIDRTADQAQQQWRDEERSRALFEREDQGQEGPHVLDRSFSGTYGKDR